MSGEQRINGDMESAGSMGINFMDLRELTAPCGLDCFNCIAYLANDNEEFRKQVASAGIPYEEATCTGCRKENGCHLLHAMGILPESESHCKIFQCVSSKGFETCADCSDFPCDNLQPFADKAAFLPHNMKVFNLALIKKMGVEKWAQEKAKLVRDRYFGEKFNI